MCNKMSEQHTHIFSFKGLSPINTCSSIRMLLQKSELLIFTLPSVLQHSVTLATKKYSIEGVPQLVIVSCEIP